ncbi:MAG: c-type cytochrome biogenesis protein CcmI [Dehalococcoidales bacterium]|nr:c-type cytochrome biogenesis protein CcmI [Dehalococcoidales bacterium]|tara:strand:- start:93 stop:521 length:429 start_codon:yes stop_codon:yes gene_type:complete
MTIFVALVLTVLTFAFVTYPLLKRRTPSANSVEDEKLQEVYAKRDTTYSMLKELEFDFQSGILTEEDYRNLEAKYKGKAISILKDINNLKKGSDVEEEIEKKILELRRGEGRFCPQCGAGYLDDDRFCSRCGTSLSQGGHVD